MERVRAKFWVTEINKVARGKDENPWTVVKMQPVCSNDPGSENKKFSEYTPVGSFQMSMTVLETAAFFELGEEYYLDFSKA
jgi:hypothetical protein